MFIFNKEQRRGKGTLLIVALAMIVGIVIFTSVFVWNSFQNGEQINQDANQFIFPVQAPVIEFNNVSLVDSTQYDALNNICYGQRLGMNITVRPCVKSDIDGKEISQYVDFEWNGINPRNISWIFVYEDELDSGSMELLKDVQVTKNTVVSEWLQNYVVNNVVSYEDLGTPDERCEMGNQDNTKMYQVTRTTNNASTQTKYYCFTDVTVNNPTTFSISGNRDVVQEVEITEQRWVNINNKIEFMGNGLLNDERSYYKVQDVPFSPGQMYSTHWIYTPKNARKSGKWHILGYESETGLVSALASNQYIYLDPSWWNNNWQRRQQIDISGSNTSLTDFTVMINVTYDSDMNSDFSDIRFLDSTSSNELYYELDFYNTSVSAVFWVRIPTLNAGIDNTTIFMYYKNPSATLNENEQQAWAYDTGVWHFSEGFGSVSKGIEGINNATTSQTPVWTDGIIGKAINVSGATGHWTVQDQDYFTANTTTGNSWLFWAQATADENNKEIWAKDDVGGNREWSIIQGTGYLFSVIIPDFDYSAYTWLKTPSNTLAPSRINYFAWTWTGQLGDQYHDVYKNYSGLSLTSLSSGAGTPSPGTSPMEFGYQLGNNRGFTGMIDEAYMFNKSLSASETWRYYQNFNISMSTFGSEEVITRVNIDLISPLNGTFISALGVFNATIIPVEVNLTNATIKIWDSGASLVYSDTNILALNETLNTSFSHTFVSDDTYTWLVEGCGDEGSTTYCELSSNSTFTVDLTPPAITINSPTNEESFIRTAYPYTITLDSNVSDANLDACWYHTSDSATNTTFTCNTTTAVSFSGIGNKTIFAYVNDSLGQEIGGQVNITPILISQYQSQDTITEGSSSVFTLTINMSNIPSTKATFKYNNTKYAPTTQSTGQNYSIFTYTLGIPSGSGNRTGLTQYWNWTYNITNYYTDQNTSTQTQKVYSLDFDNCSAYTVLVYNFTLYDEGTKTLVNATAGANIQLDFTWLSNSGEEFQRSFEVSNNDTLLVCVPINVINDSTFSAYLTAEYSSTNRVTEFYFADNQTVTNDNIPQEFHLYDLNTSDSTTFLFTFLDENGIENPGVIINTLRYYIGQGVFTEVERSKQDDNGETHIHLVEEDVIYKFNVTLENKQVFLSEQYNAKCLSTPCSITLSAQADDESFPTVFNNLPEGSFSVTADKSTRTVTLSFNLNETADMNLTVFKVNNNEVELIDTNVVSASSGSVDVLIPYSYGNATYYASVYKGDKFVATRVVDLSENGADYFGVMGLFLGALAILVLALIGASQGEWVVVWTVLGVLVASLLFFIALEWYAFLTFVAGAGILLVKLIQRRKV